MRGYNGKQIGVETGDARKFETFKQVREAFHRQIEFIMRDVTHTAGDAYEKKLIELCPIIYQSA